MGNIPQKIKIDFTDEQLTGSAGGIFLSSLVRHFGVDENLRQALNLKQRKRGAGDAEMMLSLIYSLANGDGALCDVDRLGTDDARQTLLGLGTVPGSRRLGEYLTRFNDRSLHGLRAVSLGLVSEVIGIVARAERERLGYVPLFIDGSGIEVEGNYECAEIGYNQQKQYWLHQAYVGRLWTAQRLLPGGVDVAADWRELLEETGHLLQEETDIWLRADNAYYRKEVVEFCEERGWDCSISVTNGTYKKPLKRQLEELCEDDWHALDDRGNEEAAWLVHKPSGWRSKQLYVAIRTRFDGEQKLLTPRYTFIMTTCAQLPIAEVVKRHRGKQGQENAQKGPLIDLDLHHPPCRRFDANQAFYLAGQMAQVLLVAAQYTLLPGQARKHGIRVIIRDLVRLPGRLVGHGRTTTIKFAKSALRLNWIAHAADRMEELYSLG